MQTLTSAASSVSIAMIISMLLIQLIAKKVIASMWLYYAALQITILLTVHGNLQLPASVDFITNIIFGIISLSSINVQ